MKTIPAGANGLPSKFTEQERYCYKWLEDCGKRGWLVDLLTKEVTWLDKYNRPHKFNSLVSFAEFMGLAPRPRHKKKGE